MSVDKTALDKFAPERQEPPRMRLVRAMEDTFQKNYRIVLNNLSGRLTEDVRKDFLHTVNDWYADGKDYILWFQSDQKFPVTIDDVDAIEPIHLLLSSDTKIGDREVGDAFTGLSVHLYSDNSPYMFDEDLANHDEDMADIYWIMTSPEHPPFIFTQKQYVEAGPEGTAGYLRALRERGEQPRYLSDEACESLLAVLPNFQVSPDDTLTNGNPLSYF